MIVKLTLLVSLCAMVTLIAFGVRFSRRLQRGQTRDQARDRAAVTAYRAGPMTVELPAARDDLSDGAPKTLEAWLAEDERILLRAQVTQDLAWWSAWELRLDACSEARADYIARNWRDCTTDKPRYPGGIAELRADLLIEACHHDRAELLDLVNTTCAWPQQWEDELADLLANDAPVPMGSGT